MSLAENGIDVLYIAYIGNIIKHILVRYQKACYLIYSIIKLYSTRFVHIVVLWLKWHHPEGHRVYEAVFTL